MENEEIIVRLSSPERYFTKCYHDFLDSSLLNGSEKIVFLALKRFLDVKKDKGDVFPSIQTICKITNFGETKVRSVINSLIKKGIVKKERQGLTKPNIYTISDTAQMWKCKTEDELKEAIKNTENTLTLEDHIKELERMGYKVELKEKEPDVTVPTKDTVTPSAPQSLSIYKNNDTLNKEKCQEKYSIEDIKIFFDYDIMLLDHKALEANINSVMDILYDVLNTTKNTIKIKGENKPAAVVIAKIMKLNCHDIIYAINKFCQQTKRIKNPTTYMLSILYTAKEQGDLDITNQVNHDLNNPFD